MSPVKAKLVPAVKAHPSLISFVQEAALETDPHVHILRQLEPTGKYVEEMEGVEHSLSNVWGYLDLIMGITGTCKISMVLLM